MHAREHLGIKEREADLVAGAGRLFLEQLRGGVAGIALGDVLAGGAPQELRQAEVGYLQPTMVENQTAWIQPEMRDAMLLIHVIEDFGGGAHVIDQFATPNAGQLLPLALQEPIAQRFLDEVRKQNQAARLEVNDFTGHESRMLQGPQDDDVFLELWSGAAQPVYELDQSFLTSRRLNLPKIK